MSERICQVCGGRFKPTTRHTGARGGKRPAQRFCDVRCSGMAYLYGLKLPKGSRS